MSIHDRAAQLFHATPCAVLLADSHPLPDLRVHWRLVDNHGGGERADVRRYFQEEWGGEDLVIDYHHFTSANCEHLTTGSRSGATTAGLLVIIPTL